MNIIYRGDTLLEEELKLNSVSDNVKILQEKLKILGFYNATITGVFGLATEEGVRVFQRQYNLEETGVVNDEMWKMLFELTEVAVVLYSNYPILSLGSTGQYVKELQMKLNALLYYPGEITSIFDLETENAVKRFQYNNDLTTTGIVNNQTWNLIDLLYGNLNECVTGNQVSGNRTYIVKSGDTLYSIARMFNTTVDEIKTLNNLTSNVLSIGQVLKIPGLINDNDFRTYTVKSGDTLYSIARMFNTTVDEIRRLNNLTSNVLNIGQILKIPVTNISDSNYLSYIVTRGDTLYSIANRYGISVDDLKRINNLTSNILSVGQILKVPK